jgi:GNAT superfamily N-acetyltransferase
MSDGYEIVRYRPGLKDDVAELQTHLWSPRPDHNRAYLEWKHEKNPYLKEPLIYLALAGGRVVGMRGMLGVQWEAGMPPKTFPGLCAEDSVIHPDHRNRGISSMIMKAAFEDIASRGHQYLYSLSASPVTIISSLALGWKNVGPFGLHAYRSMRAQWFRILRKWMGETRILWRWRDRLPGRRWATGRTPLHELRDYPSVCRQTNRYRIVLDSSPRPGEMADLVARMEYDGRIRHVRDREYLSWRFLNPRHRYLFLYWEEKLLEGYLVLQENVSGFRPPAQVNVVDWEGTSRQVRAGLLHAALGLCSFPDLNIWTASLSEESKIIVRDAGFQPVYDRAGGTKNIPPSLLVRSLEAGVQASEWALDGRRMVDMANWDMRMVYSMNG